MKRYIVSVSDYMGDSPDMFSIEAENDADAIVAVFAGGDDVESTLEEEGCTMEEFAERCRDDNGDGQPYYQIFSIEKDEVVFG